MGKLVSSVIKIGSLGLIKDPLGIKAGERAAGEAAGVQAGAAEAGIAETRRQFDITQEQLAPFQQAGAAALEQQQALIGLGGQEAQQQAFAGLEESRGQQFLRERGQRNLLRNAAAIGGIGGGNVREALVQQGVGFAQQDIQNQFGRLGQIAGQGQAAATNIGQFGAQAAGSISQGLAGAGQARASGILGRQQVGAQATGNLFQLGGTILGGLAGGGFFNSSTT